jgi:hypothetical protein
LAKGETNHGVLRDGQRLSVFNIAWGNDLADECAHVTTYVSPNITGEKIELFLTPDSPIEI